MVARQGVQVYSEIGRLESVILHTPGKEVESMSPDNAARALYSDILNLDIAQREYAPFKAVLAKISKVFEVEDLLAEALAYPEPRHELLRALCPTEFPELFEQLVGLPAKSLAKLLIEGVPQPRNTLTHFLLDERYAIPPLYNFYFMRDASMSIFSKVLLGRMRSPVRYGETRIMETIFKHSDSIRAEVMNPASSPRASEILIEGGDYHVVKEDVLMIGNGVRSSSQGVDFLIGELIKSGLTHPMHVLVQELPATPESFIHLDMVFTLLSQEHCMAYAPVILESRQYRTIHITVDPSGKTQIRYVENLLKALSSLGVEVRPIVCGGTADPWHQEREQWHSGANFVAFAPGKVIGYARNQHTVDELARNGFEVLTAQEVATGEKDVEDYARCIVTLEGSELPRGGGGGRCMTMPISRASVSW